MIFRDDDIQKGTNIERFIMVDNLFIKHKVIHTIAVITEDLGYNHNLVDYINKHSHIDVQLHCHTHIDFSIANENELRKQFENGLYILKECFKVKPTTFYPPWNRSSELCEKVALDYNLIVSNQKISFETYITRAGKGEDKTINFHYWHDDLNVIECGIRIYKRTLLGNNYPL